MANMKSDGKRVVIETRGRKPNVRGKILSNGLFEDQWERILKDAQSQGRDGAVILREIVDWWFDGKESLTGITHEEFLKLPKPEKTNHKNTQKE